MSSYKISIIMPTYNSENYLENTLASIFNQSIGFNNIELILVDDKSTDDTRSIIGNYSKKYDNILHIFLDKNLGHPGAVRNKGMEIASAKYIMFCDHDDEYDEDLCETLYNTITQEEDCDLVGCNNYMVDALNHPYEIDTFEKTEEKTIITSKNRFYYTNVYIWTKIFKKEIIVENNIKYITDGIGEDTIFCLEYLLYSKFTIHLNNYYGYYHYIRGDNLSTSNMKWILDYFDMIDVINIKFGSYLKDIDSDKFYQNRINSILLAMLSLKENDWTSLSTLINKLYEFESEIKYKNAYEKNFFNKSINNLIIKNHLTLATLAVYISNRIYKNKFILKFYRKFVLKK